MTKTFPVAGMSQAFLNGASVVIDGRPGRVTKVDTKVCVVEFPESWLEMRGERVREWSAQEYASFRTEPVDVPTLAEPVAEVTEAPRSTRTVSEFLEARDAERE